MKHLQNTYNSFKRKIKERITNETELEEVEKKTSLEVLDSSNNKL